MLSPLNGIEHYSVHSNNTLHFISQLWSLLRKKQAGNLTFIPSFQLTTLSRLARDVQKAEGSPHGEHSHCEQAKPHSWPWQVSMQVRPKVFIRPHTPHTNSADSVTCLRDTGLMNMDKLEWLVINGTWWTDIISRTWSENDYLAGSRYNIGSMMWESFMRADFH